MQMSSPWTRVGPVPVLSSTLRGWRHAIGLLATCLVLSFGGTQTLAQAQGLPDFTVLVENVGGSVVNIRTTERNRAVRGNGAPEMDEDMLEFFKRFGVPIPGQQNPRRNPQQPPPALPDSEPQQRGVGSGFILNADGYVMTNAHVVEGAEEVFVTLTDKRELKARVIGTDKRTDVAVVKIDATGLQAVRVGDVSRLKVGEWVIAIGSPFGLENTVTAGIVSAKARDTGDFLPFIQTDVAINPGNSGGPLINMRGEVVGINSQIYSRSGSFIGISFAIPIDEAIRVADQLRASGRVIRGRIGVQIDQVTKDVAESIGLGKPSGALVRSVEAGGPADRAGVEAGDIITKFDGRTIDKAGDLPRIVGSAKPGTKATLEVFRRGASKELNVTVVELEAERTNRLPPVERNAPKLPAVISLLGLAVSDLNDAQKSELKVKNGVRVEAIEGAAAKAGIREGDIVLSIDKTEITSVKQFEAAIGKLDKPKSVTLLVKRGEWVNYIVIRPPR